MSDVEIIKMVKGFTKGLLNGESTIDKCFMVCAPLQSYLSFGGIDCTLTEGEIIHCENTFHHFWITLSDGRIIDPTADQFGLLNIYVRKQPSYYRMYTAKDYDVEIKNAVKKFRRKCQQHNKNKVNREPGEVH